MIVRRNFSLLSVARYVAAPMAVYIAIAVAVYVAHDFARLQWLAVPALPVSILAATLGILLGFRNNSGYDRWWEARTLWGGVVNQSRTFARQVLMYLPASPASDGAPPTVVRSRLAETAAADGDPPARFLAPGAGTDGAVRDRFGAAHAPERGAAQVATIDAEPDRDGDAAPEFCSFRRVSDDARELVYAQIGFANALRCHLRRQDPLPAVAPFFRPAVLDALRGEQNVPAAILVWMATRVRARLTTRESHDGGPRDESAATLRLVAIDGTLGELANLLGGCERIKNTPIPRQYDFLPRVMVRAYLAILPLSFVDELGIATPIVTAIIAFLFLSLDGIGRNVEAPFENDIHDTPMTALSRTIEINLRQMLGETELPPPVQPVDGYLY